MWTVVMFSALVATASIVDATPIATSTVTANILMIEPGITQELTITCKAKPSLNHMPHVNGLSISFIPDSLQQGSAPTAATPYYASPQSNAKVHLASVMPYIGVKGVNPTFPVTAADGDINTAESFLEITISSPNKTHAGKYECTVSGSDDYGVLVTDTCHADIASKDPNGGDILQVVNVIKKDHIKQNGRWNAVDSNNFFMTSLVFKNNNHKYLLSTVAEDHVSLCQFMCSVHGGYLAEINDAAELDFVRSFVRPVLKGKPNYPDVFLGATDEGNKGTWKFLHNEQDTVFLEWGNIQGSGYDCMILQERADFAMNDERCDAHNRFLCEVPVY